jgi:hypothetical protein
MATAKQNKEKRAAYEARMAAYVAFAPVFVLTANGDMFKFNGMHLEVVPEFYFGRVKNVSRFGCETDAIRIEATLNGATRETAVELLKGQGHVIVPCDSEQAAEIKNLIQLIANDADFRVITASYGR